MGPTLRWEGMSYDIAPKSSAAGRLFALKEVHDAPGIPKSDLTARVQELTGLAVPTVRRLVGDLVREGHLEDSESRFFVPARRATRRGLRALVLG